MWKHWKIKKVVFNIKLANAWKMRILLKNVKDNIKEKFELKTQIFFANYKKYIDFLKKIIYDVYINKIRLINKI